MNSDEFIKLYTRQDADDAVTPFNNEIGFSLIRSYPDNTPHYKDGKKIFIKVVVFKEGLFYSVDMTRPEKRGEEPVSYIIVDGEEYAKKITNFFSDNQEPFVFDETTKKIVFKPKDKNFTINEFVEVLINNHLSDRLFFKRKLNSIADLILKLLFWLSDKHYEKIRVSVDKYNFSRDNQPIKEEEKNTEPFFKYFYISKNTIFSVLLLAFFIIGLSVTFPNVICFKRIWPFGEFSLSNPFVVLFSFLMLFSFEKFSIWLNRMIKEFFSKDPFQNKQINFIERLHNYEYHNKFKLRLK